MKKLLCIRTSSVRLCIRESGHIYIQALFLLLKMNSMWPQKDYSGVFDFWHCGVRCEVVTYGLITVRQRDVSFSAWVGESVPYFFPIWVKNLPCKHNWIYMHTRIHWAYNIQYNTQGHRECHSLSSSVSLPSASFNLLWAISRLVVTPLPPLTWITIWLKSFWTAAVQTTTRKPSSLYTAMDQKIVSTFVAV